MSLKRVRGMEDRDDHTLQKHHFIIQTAQLVAQAFCFKQISTPLLEFTDIFARTLGENSDIVHKEMFTFKDRNDDSLTLRPEGTAGVARHFLTQNQAQFLPLRYFYHGAMFRYERPQKGRLRQFHTIGVELLGEEGARGDIECISLATLFLKNLKLKSPITLEINSIGDLESRTNYQNALIKYLQPLKKRLSEDSQLRLKKNPLRILDSKDPQDKQIIQSAPVIKDFLNPRSNKFFQAVTEGLSYLNISWVLNPLLVRGLDYYNHCVFEFKVQSDKLGTQNTILGGGRYDRLIETIAGSGSRVPGVGWACGIERLCLLLDSLPYSYTPLRPIALVPLGEEGEQKAQALAWMLRKEGFCVFHPKATGSLSKKMKRAENVNAQYALIFGPEEIKNNQLSIKNMDTTKQQSVATSEVLSFLKAQKSPVIQAPTR